MRSVSAERLVLAGPARSNVGYSVDYSINREQNQFAHSHISVTGSDTKNLGTMNSLPESRHAPLADSNIQPGNRFEGKVALITGASNRGIGGAIALRLAQEGAAVSLVSRQTPDRLLKRLSRLKQGVVHSKADVTKPKDIVRAIDDCMEEFGKIDVVVNNAGVELACPLDKFDDAAWRELIDVNLNGAIAVSKAALPFLPQPDGVIVNIASVLGMAGCPGYSIYSASKAGLLGFTQSLAWELAPQRIRVVAIAPALVHTPMVHKYATQLTPAMWQQIEACHPLGVGRPEDVAAAVAFLASADARWITGITLPLGWASNYPLPTVQVAEL